LGKDYFVSANKRWLSLIAYCSTIDDAGMTAFVKYSNIIDGNLYLNCSSAVANRHSSVYMIKVA